jgi:hypothetical protein
VKDILILVAVLVAIAGIAGYALGRNASQECKGEWHTTAQGVRWCLTED